MSRNCALVVLVLLVLATSASAQEMLNTQVFSVVARGGGLAGTQWVTDLTIFNPTDAELVVGIQFFPGGQDNLLDPTFPERIVLAPHETLMVEDVLLNTFGDDEDIKGALILICDPVVIGENEEGATMLAVTRTYNTGGAEGTFGQTVPSLVAGGLNVGWGSSFVTGARNDDAFRSNLGIAGQSLFGTIQVHFRIMDQEGTALVEGSKRIRIASMNQWSFDSLGVGSVEGPLTVELWLDSDDMDEDPCEPVFPTGFLAYVSKVDNGTGDAEFLTAAPMMPYVSCLVAK
jgi:hypothetical protein